MVFQSKLLNQEYLGIRLNELPEIKKGLILFDIKESDRAFSRTLYVNFYMMKGQKKFKSHTLRISDHLIDCPHSQFLLDVNKPLTAKKKKLFVRVLQACIKKAQTKYVFRELGRIKDE